MKKFLPLFVLLFVFSKAWAQPASSYIFSTNPTVACEPITTPTVLFGSGIDDQASGLNAIGFTFNFAGVPYTQFSASTNGLICLGSTTVTTWTNTFPGNQGTLPVLMPFWDDLYTAGNGLRFQVLGTAPNRKLVIDWEVTNCCVGGTPDKHFQVWLFETSNVIQFVYDYGANVNTSTVGIASSTTEYHSITTSSQTTSTTVVDNNNTSWPLIGRSYIFSPPLPCTGTPNGGTATVSPNPPCPNTNFQLSLTGATVATSLGYQWYSSSTGLPGTWGIITGANTNFYTTQLPASTSMNYMCIVTCTAPGGGFDTSDPVLVNVPAWNPAANCYCNSSATYNLYETINSVVVGTLNNVTTCANPLQGSQGLGTGTGNQYANFTGSVSAPFVYAGLSQNFSIEVGNCNGTNLGNTAVKIYIDFNHNYSFADPGEEVYFSGLTPITSVPASVINGSFTVPGTALTGLTRMRVVLQQGGSVSATTINPCGAYNYGETEDYLVSILPPSPYDPAIIAMTGPAGNCYSASQVITAQLRNFGSNMIDLSINPVTVTLVVNGPNGQVLYNYTATSGFLNPYGASGVTVPFIGVNMFAGGTYYLNTSLVVAGLTNGNLFNDSLSTPLVRVNYRPTAGAPYQMCQFASIPFGQGMTVNGCSTPIQDSVTITFNITPTADNVGATAAGTSQTVPGAACANQFAGNYGNALVPSVLFQPGTTFPKKAQLRVTNYSTSYPSEVRFNLFSGLTTGPSMFAPTAQGVGGNDSSLHGFSANQGGFYNYVRTITPAQLSAMISYLNTQPPNTPINLGYFETWNDFISTSDITHDVGGTTTATLKVYYQYVPASFEWYSAPSGGVSLYPLSPFNPLVTTGSPLTNSNVPGTYTFYAACVGSSGCRVPVNLVINPIPVAVQDTLALCESTPGSNSAIFDLTTMNASVSNNAPGTLVEYYNDPWLFSLIPTPTNDTTNTAFVYSKVSFASGCYASDSVLLKVNSQPEFPTPVVSGFACAPGSIDAADLINPFSTVPPGTDTLYYENSAYTIPHPNPHNISTADTVYMVFKTNSTPYCADSAIALVQVIPQNNNISGQDITFNYSVAGSQGCQSMLMVDGNSDTMRSTVDCKRIAAITDVANSTSLGNVSVCQDIAASTPTHNGQPYLNRVYQITADSSDSAVVCLYYLNDDFDQYNATALTSTPTWPLLPTSASSPNIANIAITKVNNGDLNTPGHTSVSIPSNQITASYDAASTVWTVCFPVSGFSYFYAHGANALGIPLPVSLLSFTGNKSEGTSVLNWSTANEMNNSHFVVERSGDGSRFSAVSDKISSKAMNGNSQSILEYGFTDVRPMPGHNYYRLQQHDIDGHVTYSQVVDVFFGVVGTVKLYPNPVTTLLNVEVNTPKSTVARVRITDAAGRTVQVSDLQLSAGTTTTQIDMHQLADGVYRVALSDGNGLEYSQLVRKN